MVKLKERELSFLIMEHITMEPFNTTKLTLRMEYMKLKESIIEVASKIIHSMEKLKKKGIDMFTKANTKTGIDQMEPYNGKKENKTINILAFLMKITSSMARVFLK